MRSKKAEEDEKRNVEKIAYKDNQITQIEGSVIKRDPCSEIQAKIITYLAAMVKDGDTSATVYTMDVDKFLKMVSKNDALGGSRYNTVKKNLSDLRRLGLDIQITAANGETKIVGFSFIYEYTYNSKTGTIDFQLHDKLINFYNNYNYRFTMIDVATVMRLRGKYTIPLYEFLLSWRGAKVVTCSTDKLRQILSIPQNKYKKTRSIFEWCVYPALEEINDKSNIKVEMVPLEVYRKEIQKMEFRIENNDTPLEARKELMEPLNPIIALLIKTGVAEKVAKKISKDYSEKRIKENFEMTKKAKIAGLVKNFSAFFVKAIKDDYARTEIGDLFGDQIIAEEKEKQEKRHEKINTALDAENEREFAEKYANEDISQSDFIKKYPWLVKYLKKEATEGGAV